MVVHEERLWHYHGLGRYSSGHGEREDNDGPGNSADDMAEADRDVNDGWVVKRRQVGAVTSRLLPKVEEDLPGASPPLSPPRRRP